MTQITTDPATRPINPRMICFGAMAGLVAMGLLAATIISQFRAVQLRDTRDIGGAFIQGFLAPYAQEAHRTGALGAASESTLSATITRLPTDRQFDRLRIWSKDEVLWFDSNPISSSADHDTHDLREALAGRAVAVLEDPGTAGAIAEGIDHPFVEIYAPIYDTTGKQLIAVGEIYQDARQLLAERSQFERRVWGSVGLATLGFLAMMWLVARQQRQLMANIVHQEKIAAQNAALKEAAEAAWRSSSQSNEALLNQLGAELHDGPVQMLSLLALMAPQSAAHFCRVDAAGTGPAYGARDADAGDHAAWQCNRDRGGAGLWPAAGHG